jgi:hypothetical protein
MWKMYKFVNIYCLFNMSVLHYIMNYKIATSFPVVVAWQTSTVFSIENVFIVRDVHL